MMTAEHSARGALTAFLLRTSDRDVGADACGATAAKMNTTSYH